MSAIAPFGTIRRVDADRRVLQPRLALAKNMFCRLPTAAPPAAVEAVGSIGFWLSPYSAALANGSHIIGDSPS